MDCGGAHPVVGVGSDDNKLCGVHDHGIVCTSSAGVLARWESRKPVSAGVSCPRNGAPPVPRHCRCRVDNDRGTNVGPVFAVVHDGGRLMVNSAMAAQRASWVFHRRGLSNCWWLMSPIQAYGFVVVEDRLHVLWFAQGGVVMATHQTACRLVVDLDREPLTVIGSAWPCRACLLNWTGRYG